MRVYNDEILITHKKNYLLSENYARDVQAAHALFFDMER